MRFSILAPVSLVVCFAGLSAAQYECTFDNAEAWPSDSSSSSSSGDDSALVGIEGAASAQAICLSNLDADASECDGDDSGSDDDGGILSKRQQVAAAQSLTCADSEVCLVYPTGYLICIDPNSGDYLDQFESGNLLTGAHTDASNGTVTSSTATDNTSSSSVRTTSSDVGYTSSMTTTAATTDLTGQSSATTGTSSGSATAQSTGAAASQAVGAWEIMIPAAIAPFLAVAL